MEYNTTRRVRMKIPAFLILISFVIMPAAASAQAGSQDLSAYEKLKDPAIVTMPATKMLVVEAKGDPNVAGQQAFGLLFKTFFSIPGARMAPPRARWFGDVKTPKDQWVGQYALPVPDAATLPPGSGGAKIEVWEYGEVAEILHAGSYADEPPTVERLMKFIASQGYVVAGPHEEEYLRGPESGPDATQYRTIIRYQVKKKSPDAGLLLLRRWRIAELLVVLLA
jgi:effector-binding domain-containing protein